MKQFQQRSITNGEIIQEFCVRGPCLESINTPFFVSMSMSILGFIGENIDSSNDGSPNVVLPTQFAYLGYVRLG